MTPKTKTSEGSREKLIEATIELMSAHGFEPMGISAILEKSGVTKSNFYYHFKSKEELCLAALDEMESKFFDELLVPALSDKSRTPKERLLYLYTCMIDKMVKNCCDKGCPFVNLATETSDFHPLFREKIDAYYKNYTAELAKVIDEGMKSGEFRKDISAPEAANLLIASINGTIVLAKVKKDADIMKKNLNLTLQLISK